MPTAPTRAQLLAFIDQMVQLGLALTDTEDAQEPPAPTDDPPLCIPVRLPTTHQIAAAQTARRLNPANAPRSASQPPEAVARVLSEPLHIAVLTSKSWGPTLRRLTVSFVDTTVPQDLRARILEHMNAWQCGISFALVPGIGQVRIGLGPGGYWSYLGTDILHIAPHMPTMNLQGFSMQTPESEFKRVVRHETGHTLACPHEHMRQELVDRIDHQKAYAFFQLVYGWPPGTVDAQVLTPLDEASIMGTAADATSIMCYQLPGRITRDGKAIIGGIDINATDRTFAQGLYPLGQPCMPATREAPAAPGEGDEAGFVYDAASLE